MFDSHVHSSYSYDCSENIEKIVKKAIAIGIYELTIADHYELINLNRKELKFDIQKRKKDIESVNKKYSNRIKVKSAIEVGQPFYDKEIFDSIGENVDFLIGSVHRDLEGRNIYETSYYIDLEAALEKYYKAIYEVLKIDGVDVIAHLNLIDKYRFVHKRKYYKRMDNKILDQIFKLMIKKDIVLEVNTSMLKIDTFGLMPTISMLNRYWQLGGRYINIGSDAHFINDIGYGIPMIIDIVKKIGFDYLVSFNKRKKYLIRM